MNLLKCKGNTIKQHNQEKIDAKKKKIQRIPEYAEDLAALDNLSGALSG